MEYNDAPSLYQYGLNDPVNNSDPMGEEVYLVYREFHLDLLREGHPLIGHVYLAFDSKGLEDPEGWRALVEEIGGQKTDPERDFNPEAETFSFHPWNVRKVNGVRDYSHDLLLPLICTAGSYIGYNDDYDQRTFQGREGGSQQVRIVPLGVTQEVQERLYRNAISSRNTNNQSALYSDIGTYELGVNNCGTWAKYILESSRVAWPDEAKSFNLGFGIGSGFELDPGTRGMVRGLTEGVCVGGLVLNQIGEAAMAIKRSWDSGCPSIESAPPAAPGSAPICTRRGCVDPVTQRPIAPGG